MSRTLTGAQERTLDRVCESAACDRTRVIGWLAGGPVLRFDNGGLAIISPNGLINDL